MPEVSEGNFNDWAPRLFVLPPYKSNVLMAPISLRILSSCHCLHVGCMTAVYQ
jgi:hypothetical protein